MHQLLLKCSCESSQAPSLLISLFKCCFLYAYIIWGLSERTFGQTILSSMSQSQVQPIINMFKPSLKRSNPTEISPLTNPTSPSEYWELPQRKHYGLSRGQLVASSLLRPPTNSKPSTIFTPLFALPHQYPPEILAVLNNEGGAKPGSYKEMNWLVLGKRLWFWVTGELSCSFDDFEAEITSVAMGQLKCLGLPHRVRTSYLFALGVKNQVVLKAVDPYSLRTKEIGMRYTLSCSWQIQHISFYKQKTLLIYSAPDFLQVIEFSESRRTLQTYLAFYKRYLPTRFTPPAKTIDNLLYTQDYIYLLCSEKRRPSWISKTLGGLWQDSPEQIVTLRFVEIHQVINSPTPRIEYIYSISEKDLTQRLRGSLSLNEEVRITDIFLNGQSKQAELGIVTEGGHFLTLRKDINRAYLSKDPLLSSSTCSMESLFLMSQVKAFTDHSSSVAPHISHSLGLNNLSITDDSVMWIGQQRVDCVRSQGIIGSIFLKRIDEQNCYLFGNQQWSVFTEGSFYSLRHYPLRHLLISTFHVTLNHYGVCHSLPLQANIRKVLERLQTTLSSPRLLKELIEIIISGEKYISVNTIVLEVLERELSGQSAQNYLDWNHQLRPSISKQEILVTQKILAKVWNLIFTLQYKEVAASQKYSKPISETSVYWLAVHAIYYRLIAPLLELHPRDFRDCRLFIENTFEALSSLRSFFQLKHAHQAAIRDQSLSRVRSAPFGQDFSLNATVASFEKQPSDMSWVEQGVRKLVCNKIFRRGQLQAEERLFGTIEATLNLMTLFFSLSQHELRLPAFGDVLKSKQQLEQLANKLLEICDLEALAEINQKMPELGLEKHINFRRWSQNACRQRIPASKIALSELAEIVSSPYFNQMLSLLQNRYDLHLQALELYEAVILARRETLVQSNTLKQRHILSSAIFPEDREIALANEREYLEAQLTMITSEKKRTTEIAVRGFATEISSSRESLLNQLIEVACRKPSLQEHLISCLMEQGCIDKLGPLERATLRSRSLLLENSGTSKHTRQLFPDIH